MDRGTCWATVHGTTRVGHNLVSVDFPGGSDGKASAYNAGDPGSISGLGRSPGEVNGNPLQYSCLKNPMDKGAWQTTVLRVAKSWTLQKLLSMHTLKNYKSYMCCFK